LQEHLSHLSLATLCQSIAQFSAEEGATHNDNIAALATDMLQLLEVIDSAECGHAVREAFVSRDDTRSATCGQQTFVKFVHRSIFGYDAFLVDVEFLRKVNG